jgi:hypothetical protein
MTWFIALVAIHAALWSVKGYVPRGLGEAIFFTSFLPWLPFAWAGVPWFSAQSIVAMPSALGLAWCAAVWLVIYWFVAGGLDRLTSMVSPDQRSKHAA